MRKYHITVINNQIRYKNYMTSYAMSYDECCTMFDKLDHKTWKKYRTFKIEQVLPDLG